MKPVKIYTMTTCPRCKVLKMKLKQKEIPYEEITDMEIFTELGIKSVPVLEVGGDRMNFAEANTWINKV